MTECATSKLKLELEPHDKKRHVTKAKLWKADDRYPILVHEDGVLLNGTFREWAPGMDQKTKTAARYSAAGGAFNTKEGLDEWTGQFLAPDSEATPETAAPQTGQEFDLSGLDEGTKKLVGETQSPLMSKDIPEMSSQEEADKFLTSWRKKAGLSR